MDWDEGDLAQRVFNLLLPPDEDNQVEQEDVAERGNQNVEEGADQNRDVILVIGRQDRFNISELFRQIDQDGLVLCRLWLIFLLASRHRQLSNELRQMFQGYRYSLYNRILSRNSVNRRAFVHLNSELERRRHNVPNRITRIFGESALEIVTKAYDDRIRFEWNPEEGSLAVLDAFINIVLLTLIGIFLMIITFIPSVAKKLLRPPDRRFDNGHHS